MFMSENGRPACDVSPFVYFEGTQYELVPEESRSGFQMCERYESVHNTVKIHFPFPVAPLLWYNLVVMSCS